MTAIENLCEAIRQGAALDEIIKIIKGNPEIVNESHPVHKTYPVDFAAQAGRIDVLELLKREGASFANITPYSLGVLYWATQCNNASIRCQVIEWLSLPENLSLLDRLNINLVLTANNHPDKGMSLAWVLAYQWKWELLESLSKNSPTPIELNAMPAAENHPYKGISLAWFLADNEGWKLLELLSKNSASPVELNAMPMAENHFDKGISLAWVLADNERWELLELLSKNSASPIELNAMPTKENHPGKGISLALILAINSRWELLELLSRNPASPTDLNVVRTQDKADDHDWDDEYEPYVGVSLAWILANNRKWELLESLIKNSASPIELNAMPTADNHPIKGISLAWILAIKGKWELLESLSKNPASPIELNAMTTIDNNPSKAISLAWILARHRKWELLESLIKNSASPIELNTMPTAENHPDKGVSFISLLVRNKRYDLIEAMVRKYPQLLDSEILEGKPGLLLSAVVEGNLGHLIENRLHTYSIEEIEKSYEREIAPSQIQHMIKIVFAKKINEKITEKDLNDYKDMSEEQQKDLLDNLNNIFELYSAIPESSHLYKEANREMSDVLLRLSPFSELSNEVLKFTLFKHEFNSINESLLSTLSSEDKIKILFSIYAAKAQDVRKISVYMAHILRENSALKRKVNESTSKIESAESEQPHQRYKKQKTSVNEELITQSMFNTNTPQGLPKINERNEIENPQCSIR